VKIEYQWCKEFNAEEVQRLFRSLEWSSADHPEEVRQALLESHAVYSAWADGRLVGLMNAISDGIMTAYFHYLAVHPEYQGMGIGKQLVSGMLDRYDSCMRKLLVSYDGVAEFYRGLGFEEGKGVIPMYITKLAD
jgi:ribosomal protein S18 acetylase RimI-like enzyme